METKEKLSDREEYQPTQDDLQKTIPELRAQLINSDLPLKQRFRCIFTLRNIGGSDAIEALSQGEISLGLDFSNIQSGFKDTSALLRHEVAYCLGQMEDAGAIEILNKVLEEDENCMVRHEVRIITL